MKKTNIRIKNNFIFEDENQYYISSIDNLEKWKKINDNEIENYKEENITDSLNSLMEKYDINSNVNFFDIKDDKKIVKVKQGG